MKADYLTVKEAAERLRVTPGTVKRYIYSGALPSVKMPGGQHRIALADVDALLSGPVADAMAPAEDAGASPTDIAALEQRVTQLETEVECLQYALQVATAYCKRTSPFASHGQESRPPAESEHRVIILGPGCPHCDRLAEMAGEVAGELAPDHSRVTHVRDLDEIAAYGPVLTPALVVDDTVVFSGKVPSRRAMRKMLTPLLN